MTSDPIRHGRGCPASRIVTRPKPTDDGDRVTWCADCMRHGLTTTDPDPERTES